MLSARRIPILHFSSSTQDYFSGSLLILTEKELILQLLTTLDSELWDKGKKILKKSGWNSEKGKEGKKMFSLLCYHFCINYRRNIPNKTKYSQQSLHLGNKCQPCVITRWDWQFFADSTLSHFPLRFNQPWLYIIFIWMRSLCPFS